MPNILHAKKNITCKQNQENHIEKIIVEIYKDRSWTKNNIKILISNTRTIPKKLRKRYKGEIKFHYTNGSLCVLKAKIRQNGDFKDHFVYSNNKVKQSLDVSLTNGNLGGITKFKLLLDGTRGNTQDEIFLTELLRELNFISPRTQSVKVYVNGTESIMILQEKSTKEMLEYNGRIESAIFETNENDYFKTAEKFDNNNLTIDEIGLFTGFDKATMGQFSRQINNEWSLKSQIHLEISLRALSNLNLVYVNFSNNFILNSKSSFMDYNFDNTLLANQNIKNKIKLDKFNLIIRASNASHALAANNRKFYWNKLENYFEPIYYDGDTIIYKNENIKVDAPFGDNINEAINELEHSLATINLRKFKQKLKNRGLNFADYDIKKKITAINYNLLKLKATINTNNSSLFKLNNRLKVDRKMIDKTMINKKKINSKSLFIFKEINQEFNENFLLCKSIDQCKKITFTKQEQSKLLSGDLFKNKHEYIYIGYYPDLNIKSEIEKFNFINYPKDELNFYYNEGIEFNFNKEKNEFNIFQLKPEARAYFINSNLKDLNINFNGFKNFNNLFFLPFDLRGLTGCLTFYNSNFENINLKSNYSSCEDSINMVNVKGQINNIYISNSYSDALDIDFSTISIKNITIKGSKNDCVDVSAGKYNFNYLDLDACGDKGLSVGEESEIKIHNINVNNSKLGIASKDGSIAIISYANIKNVDRCLGSYNKKQEFSGGYIKINEFKCNNFIKENIIDDQSKILLQN